MRGSVLVETAPCEAPPHLSPSSIGTWQQCPLRYKLGRIDKIQEPPTSAQLLGSFTHEVLEFLYQLPRDARTLHSAKLLSKQLWDEKWMEEAKILKLSAEQERQFRWQVWWCIEALFRMEDPSAMDLGGTEQRLETFIDGTKLLGILDRWHTDENGLVVISDYKTGKKPQPKYEAEKKFQLAVYVHLVEKSLGLSVSYTELLYLKEGVRWKFEPDTGFVDGVIQTVSSVAKEVASACSDGAFEAKPSKLCDWCSFRPSCPAWK